MVENIVMVIDSTTSRVTLIPVRRMRTLETNSVDRRLVLQKLKKA